MADDLDNALQLLTPFLCLSHKQFFKVKSVPYRIKFVKIKSFVHKAIRSKIPDGS